MSENFSHNDAEQFFGWIGQNREIYSPIRLMVEYVGEEDQGRIHRTELSLAGIALKKGCKYVTNIDYCGHCIAATGWKMK